MDGDAGRDQAIREVHLRACQARRVGQRSPEKDREFVLDAVAKYPDALAHASDDLKSDRAVVLAAVSRDGRAWEYVVDNGEMRHDSVLKYASDDLKADRDIVLAAVSAYGYALKYASDDLRADRCVVLAAVTNHGCALDFASYKLKTDREILLAAIPTNAHAFKEACLDIASEQDFVVDALNRNADVYHYITSDTLKRFPILRAYAPDVTPEIIERVLCEETEAVVRQMTMLRDLASGIASKYPESARLVEKKMTKLLQYPGVGNSRKRKLESV